MSASDDGMGVAGITPEEARLRAEGIDSHSRRVPLVNKLVVAREFRAPIDHFRRAEDYRRRVEELEAQRDRLAAVARRAEDMLGFRVWPAASVQGRLLGAIRSALDGIDVAGAEPPDSARKPVICIGWPTIERLRVYGRVDLDDAHLIAADGLRDGAAPDPPRPAEEG